MGSDELDRISNSAEWYLKDQLDFDRQLINFRYQTIKPHLKGPEGEYHSCGRIEDHSF